MSDPAQPQGVNPPAPATPAEAAPRPVSPMNAPAPPGAAAEIMGRGPAAPAEVPPQPRPGETEKGYQARLRQVIDERNRERQEKTILLGRVQEQERLLAQRQADPLEGLRALLAPKEVEPADPLERDLIATRKQVEQMQQQLREQAEREQTREATAQRQAYQAQVNAVIVPAIDATGLSNQAKRVLYQAVLTDLVGHAETGRQVSAETIRSFVRHHASAFAPPARPVQQVSDPAGAVGEAAPAVRLMGASQSAMGPARQAPRNPKEAHRMISELIERRASA